MPVINVYNEKSKCDKCNKTPVQFILSTNSESVEKLCFECFATYKNESKTCQ